MKEINLKNITLVAISSIKMDETILALEKSMKGLIYSEVILISHQKPDNLPSYIKFKQCKKIESINDYNYFILFNLCDYINSEYALVVQYDGYVLNSDKWSDVFLKYDYIGAPWSMYNYFIKGRINIRVGNGGFSLRSKKILSIFKELNISFANHNIGNYHEDVVICVYCRKILEDYGIKFAPVQIASIFSCEEKLLDSELKTFGFHTYNPKIFNKFKKLVKLIINLLHINFIRYSNKIILSNKPK